MDENELDNVLGIGGVSGNDPGNECNIYPDAGIGVSNNDGNSTSEFVYSDIYFGGSDISGNNAGSDNIYEVIVVENDDEMLSSIREEISALNVTVFMLFMFLLLSWTEKKFSVIVNRFTRERK